MTYVRTVSIAALLMLCASCGGGSDSGGQEALARKVKLVPLPSPTPTPTPTSTATSAPLATTAAAANLAGLVQLDAIPSNFDTSSEMVAGALPASNAGDVVGAFRMSCKASHNAYDDPIVYPGQPGKSHLHTFFGNTKTDAYSTYQSLRTTGESTCHSKLNRSAYWVPALMNGLGKVVMPDELTVYYKNWPASSPLCTQAGKGCVPLPRGLRMVFGRSMTDPNQKAETYFNCTGTGAVPGTYETLAEAAKNCPSGAQLAAVNVAPNCWNGTELDSADHRSHLAFAYRDGDGIIRCPSTHPWVIPHYTLAAFYTTDSTLDRSGSTDPNLQTWFFASDRMTGMANKVPGSTFHADWFGAWDDNALMAWQTNCIDKLNSCNAGNLGNGFSMKWLAGFNFIADPRLVDPPIRITAMLCTGKSKLRPVDKERRRRGKPAEDVLSQRMLFADLSRRWFPETGRVA